MENQNQEMRTRNGLKIVRNDRDIGGFAIDLVRPEGDINEGATYATINRGAVGGWYSSKPGLSTFPDVVELMNVLDAEYGEERRTIERTVREAQQQREQLDESFAPDWQRIIDHFGDE